MITRIPEVTALIGLSPYLSDKRIKDLLIDIRVKNKLISSIE